eukprot:CAMPEP_0202901958 /NCGR_PEP_ID=MMETSP1392-20130828/15551_1 /ASSEMBLY_ACC=CAM_ASM_000868 /TAXON_ID=225041 /ORGANISM="Chlamydomonas chlamydogama, Strain SAG 11-48b" /LENGTH=119 /DNA_ID=CAMNT_0049588627 /DNA_START=52 /DNA_END=411 /DNA_ORIENTATION=+
MAKSLRSKVKRALRAVKREKQPNWVAEAEQKRLDALAKCIAAEPVEVASTAPEAEEPARGRDASGDMAKMDTDSGARSLKKKGRGINVKGVQKKRAKKVSPLWVNQFHTGKGKKGGKRK